MSKHPRALVLAAMAALMLAAAGCDKRAPATPTPTTGDTTSTMPPASAASR